MPESESSPFLPPEMQSVADRVHSQYRTLANMAMEAALLTAEDESTRFTALADQYNLTADSIARLYEYGEPELSETPEPRERMLTAGQLDVLDTISRGLTIREAASYLGLPHGAVVGRLQRGLKSLAVNSSVKAIVKLSENGQLPEIPEYEERDPVMLTERQQEVYRMVIEGFSDKEIGERLYLTTPYITDIINQVARENGFRSRLEAVRYFLQTGGPKTKDRTEIFLQDAKDIMWPEYGMYARWTARTFLNFVKRPITVENMAKVLFGDEYNELTKPALVDRAGSLLYACFKPAGAKGRISGVSYELAAHGLELHRRYGINSRNLPITKFIAWPIGEDMIDEDIGQALTDDELREQAVKLRAHEVGFPPGFLKSIQELEERMKHPPPHYEIMRLLRERGWRNKGLLD